MTEKTENGEAMWLRHCRTEDCSVDPLDGETSGEIPAWVEGSFYRTGCGVQDYAPQNHAFDNMAVVHAVEIKGGRARYRNRVVESECYKSSRAAGRVTVTQFGTLAAPDPCQTMLGRFMTRFRLPDRRETSDNPGVNVFFHGDELFATTETSAICRVDPHTLATFPKSTYHMDYLAVNFATAHPHVLPDGTVLNLANSMFRGTHFFNVVRFPPPTTTADGKYLSAHDQATVVAAIPAKSKWAPSYYHSFGLTDRFVVFAEQPFAWNVPKLLLSRVMGYTVSECFKYDPEGDVFFHLVDRETGEKVPFEYKTEAFACYHHINAYEEDGQVVVDLCAADGNVYNRLYNEALRNNTVDSPVSTPTRFVLPLSAPEGAGKDQNLVTLAGTSCQAFAESEGVMVVTGEKLSDHAMEMPKINYDRNGIKYRFFYGVGYTFGNVRYYRLFKNDTVLKRVVGIFEEPSTSFCEPVFVPRPGATEEDDGVVLSFAYKDFQPNYTAMIVLDGKTFKEVARVSYTTKGVVPFSLHGVFKEKMAFK